MEKFCNICGAELGENGVCPNCAASTDEPASETIEEAAVETATEKADEAKPEEKVEEAKPEEQESVKTEAHAAPEEPQYAPPAAQEQSVRPSKFYFTFKQIGNVLKHFFSKNTVEAVAAQFYETMPIWVVLMPLCALISAVSMTMSFDGTRGLSIGAGSLFTGMSLSYFEIFLISFAMSLAVEFVYSIAVTVFFKAFKIKVKFKSAANLTMSAYIAVILIDLVNIVSVGRLNSESTAVSGFGMIAFILLLYIGITKVLNGKKPFWSFFFMITCASLVALIAALVVTCPIIVMRGLEELASTITIN